MKLEELRARVRVGGPIVVGPEPTPNRNFSLTMPAVPKDGCCEQCDCAYQESVQKLGNGLQVLGWEDSRTLYPGCGECEHPADHPIHQYPGDERGRHRYIDPNNPILLCRLCAREHHKHWDEAWAEYHAGLL